MKLFLKGDRCYTDKCAFERRPYPPGQHGHTRPKLTNYGLQLREKQKVKRMYGILERQFRMYVEKASRMKGISGENLLILLERRLDNVVYRLGFAVSRSEARQLIRHNHFLVNDKKVNIPSYLVKVGDVIKLKENSRKITKIAESLEAASKRGLPKWLECDRENFTGKVISLPSREDITIPIQENLIIEFYSR